MNLCSLVGGCLQFYGLLFGVLIVVFAIWLNKNDPSVAKMVLSVAVSIILTAVIFIISNPAYAGTVIINLLIGFGAMGLLYFSKGSWSGFAGSIVVAVVVLAIYMAYANPGYAFLIGIGLLLAIVAIAILGVVIHGMNKGYTYKRPEKVRVSLIDEKTGKKLIANGRTGGYIGPGEYAAENQPTHSVYQLQEIVRQAQNLFPDPKERATYLLSSPQYPQVEPYIDRETAQVIKLLPRNVQVNRE